MKSRRAFKQIRESFVPSAISDKAHLAAYFACDFVEQLRFKGRLQINEKIC